MSLWRVWGVIAIPRFEAAVLNQQQQLTFTRLWTSAQPTVNQYVGSLIRESAAAQDVVQNISVALLKKYPEYDESRPFLPWALGVAKFEVLAHRRDAARNRLVGNPEFLDQYTAGWAECALEIRDESAALRHCVSELAGRAKSVVTMRYAEDLTSQEIAGDLGLSAANVRTILKRAREALRRCVEKQLPSLGDPA